MNGLIHSSLYFGMLVSVGAYMLGVWLKKKTGWAILNPLLVAIIVVIAFLSVFHIEYKEYNRGAVYLSYFRHRRRSVWRFRCISSWSFCASI
ncbi:MAG: LrgB family protein [Clostridium fessum]